MKREHGKAKPTINRRVSLLIVGFAYPCKKAYHGLFYCL